MSTPLDAIYSTAGGLPDPLPAEPFSSLSGWLSHATANRITDNPNAMALATIDPDGRPSVRIVLCKDLDILGGSLTFFTNYESRKADALSANSRAAVVFHWDSMERQVRVEGLVRRATPGESDAYFATRHWQSRIGAWASRQSRPIDSRETLLSQVAQTILDHDIDLRPLIDAAPTDRPMVNIPRPPHWGGYRLWADRVELWVGGSGRIHDRALWSRTFAPASITAPVDSPPPRVTTNWSVTRLQP